MSSVWGNNIKVSLFGESHGKAIGCVIDNLPSGIPLDIDFIKKELLRRSAKSYEFATPRKEDDDIKILSGYFNNKTTGTPLCIIIENKDTRSHDYTPEILRPGHADYTAYHRYKGFQDYRGGGHFSGRITAPLVISGAICKQVINYLDSNIKFGSRIKSIGFIEDRSISDWNEYLNLDLSEKKYPLLNDKLVPDIEKAIKEISQDGDSLGGIIETWITGLKPGLGNPFFDSVESELASLAFSIPAVKGIEFGLGFNFSKGTGFSTNDSFQIKDSNITTITNNNGGINGGITNGMPVVFRVVIKPTATIKKKQKTINYKTLENVEHEFIGRHDPCIVLRAPVILESISAMVILNLLMGHINA